MAKLIVHFNQQDLGDVMLPAAYMTVSPLFLPYHYGSYAGAPYDFIEESRVGTPPDIISRWYPISTTGRAVSMLEPSETTVGSANACLAELFERPVIFG